MNVPIRVIVMTHCVLIIFASFNDITKNEDETQQSTMNANLWLARQRFVREWNKIFCLKYKFRC